VCSSDLDYLPVWADYSYPTRPTRLIWHGLTCRENYEQFFGAVVLFDCHDFERINGFSNDFAGWGWEDTDLRLRVEHAGLSIDRRDGTYMALPHKHNGYQDDGSLTPEAVRNRLRFEERIARLDFDHLCREDGLSDLRFQLLGSRNVRLDGGVLNHVFHHLVGI
jgi:GT2 family glycosyltransferase